jgi:cyclopropane fatty-acyl-phospholipid synthase-like methyltransferase
VSRTWGVAVFDQLYATSADPWGYRHSRYEARKYRATLNALGKKRFAAAFEPGCSIGVLTRQLARRCASLLAMDGAQAALQEARARCRDLPHVAFQRATLPQAWPRGRRFDLIVLSEMLYFLSPADMRLVARRARASLRASGVILLVNYTGPNNAPQTGTRASAGFAAACGMRRSGGWRRGQYRMDRFQRGPAAF